MSRYHHCFAQRHQTSPPTRPSGPSDSLRRPIGQHLPGGTHRTTAGRRQLGTSNGSTVGGGSCDGGPPPASPGPTANDSNESRLLVQHPIAPPAFFCLPSTGRVDTLHSVASVPQRNQGYIYLFQEEMRESTSRKKRARMERSRTLRPPPPPDLVLGTPPFSSASNVPVSKFFRRWPGLSFPALSSPRF